MAMRLFKMSSILATKSRIAYGAGGINPLVALSPGLIYDAKKISYIKMLCDEGHNTKNLRIIIRDYCNCTSVHNRIEYQFNIFYQLY
ncbi:hypothetical protein IEQ34_005898 [Dendrobium chrysotoxum]|uniref:Uncharacterized protein n=1 Tax=Dendrobium chrysotoxum TaxID=161865 RepID=A0AAV7GVB0_DENCH|nr:hypothetical protein IEQ34_005898 [Dendrobium chrysotoxum]